MVKFGLETSNQENSKTLIQTDTSNPYRKLVAGVVVLYNPSYSVIDNIYSYIDQVGILYIIDNSDKPCEYLTDLVKSNLKCTYIYNNENLGIAKALNIGAKRAINDGYHYLLTMDQDSRASENLVSGLLKVIESNERIGIVSPLHSNKYNTHLKQKKEITEETIVMTSGNLLSLNVYREVGNFLEDFFIDYVDIEYCIRMNMNSFRVFCANNVVLEHNEGNLSKKNFLFWTFYPSNNPPLRLYYKSRNLLYLREIYRKKYPQPLQTEYNAYLRNFAKIILFERQKLVKCKMILTGVIDYMKKKKGQKI